MILQTGHWIARNGNWCEEMHDLVCTEDHPIFSLACKFDEKPEQIGTLWRFVFTDRDWSNFIMEANGHMLIEV